MLSGTLFTWLYSLPLLIVVVPCVVKLMLAGPTVGYVGGGLPAQGLWTSIDLIAVVLSGNFRVDRWGISLAENGLDR